MTWERLKLGDLFQIKHGWAFKGEYFSNKGELIIVTPGNFFEKGGFRQLVGKEKFYLGEFPEDFLLKKGDVIIAMTEQGPGLLGSPALVPSDEKYLHNQRIGLIHNIKTDKIDSLFIYRLFFTSIVRNEIFGSATGTKVKHTAPKRIYDIEAPIPPLPTQRKIASILSAYDDLIENNLKRIKLLEEQAFCEYRLITNYKETRLLGDILKLNYGKSLSASNRKPGIYSVYGSSGVVGFNENYLVKGPGIIVGRKGNVGTVFWSQTDFFPIDTVYYIESEISFYFLYFNLKYSQHFDNSDAAVPGLNRNSALSNNINLPSTEDINEFEDYCKLIFDLIHVLQKQNTKLCEARDILLPKLMNGDIEVN